ncbi:MAG TPA: DUF58 domain-containing protein [Acidimicrobiia bacterium]|nr:DUF58 domain-containing protein [Acidimicrobiia bacterium]
MSPSPRAAIALLIVGFVALAVPGWLAITLAIAVVMLTAVDMALARREPRVRRTISSVLARGIPASLAIETNPDVQTHVDLRQARPPDFTIEPSVGRGTIDSQVVAHRRGAHRLPPVAARRRGPLGLGTCTFDADGGADLLVYPDVFAAQRLVIALRRGRFRDPGLRTRGPLGLGTEFESVRDYLPDDDVRQINWQATERTGRPMSNQYRIEQDRDVVCLVDAGRLMAAPLTRPADDTHPEARPTRLDAAVDAVTMVALVADELGDRCGVTVYDSEVRRRLAPRRAGGNAVVRTILDVEPTLVDSDHDLAFRAVGGVKRALIVVLTDLVDEAAARSLLDAVPVLARRHAVVVASVRDPDLDAPLVNAPQIPRDVYAGAVALDVLDGRARVMNRLRHQGATVIEAPPELLGEACVRAYLRLKSRARL